MKDETIRIRCTSEEKAAILKIADSKNISLTKLILDSVFSSSDKVSRPLKPLKLCECWYHGIIFKFTLEADDDELVTIGRIYKGGKEIKTGIKFIFGRTVKDIFTFSDEYKAAVFLDRWMASLDAEGNNTFRDLMDK